MVILFHIQMNKIKSLSSDNKTRSAYPKHDVLFYQRFSKQESYEKHEARIVCQL